MQAYIFEFIGTLMLILLGDGVCACTSLEKSKGKGAGWIVVTMAWGFAVMCGVFVAGPYSGAHLNPVVSLGMALAGTFDWALVPGYVVAQLLGGFCGAVLVWLFYKDQYDATDDPDVKLGTFCTMPAVYNPLRNTFCEAVGTFVLVFCILLFGTGGNTPAVGMGSLGAIPVTCLIMAIGMSLGGATGYAINPARDLPPRLAHCLLPIKGKGGSGWRYSWVPVVGPAIGAAFAAGLFLLIPSCSTAPEAYEAPSYEKQAVELPGVDNARQLGGYVIGDKKVRMGLLLRSGALAKASDEALATLRDEYHLAMVADFRSSMERGKAPDREIDGATNVWLPVLEKIISRMDGTSSAMMSLHFNKDNPSLAIELLQQPDIREALDNSYDTIVFDDDYNRSYAAFLDSLVALPAGRAALWHCTHGKDRCGWGTAFVLAALGADRSLIVDDFALSNVGYTDDIEQLASVARENGLEDELIEYIYLLRGVSVSFFEKTLDAIDARYGSLDNFLEQALSLSPDEKLILREKFLEKR